MYRRTVTILPNWFWHIYQDDIERNASRAIRRLDEVVSDILTNYRDADQGQDAEFLRTLVDSSKAIADIDPETKTKPLTDLEVAAQIKGFIVAGTETTSTLIAAALWQLCLPQNAHLVEDLRSEVASILGQDMCVRTQAQWDHLQLVQATLKETNRLYGPSPTIGVQATSVNQKLPGGYIVQPQVFIGPIQTLPFCTFSDIYFS
jgi:cytochrome P450